MKEFNVSKQNKKDKITENDESELLFGNNDPIDNKINKDLKEIKDKLNAEKLNSLVITKIYRNHFKFRYKDERIKLIRKSLKKNRRSL